MSSGAAPDFTRARHTFVASDFHLSTAEPPHPRNPYWKKFKRTEFFIDAEFAAFLTRARREVSTDGGAIELVLNGDIFDFDSVMRMPAAEAAEPAPGPGVVQINWLERARGLSSEEAKSRFKIREILRDHAEWCAAMRDFLNAGHRVVFVIGNHDIELHWPTVQAEIRLALEGESGAPEASRVRFCEWFYVSNSDTLIEHGNQYDAYSLGNNPINPLIRKGSRVYVRIPFGNLAGRFMLNGMGLMNPHAESSFIKETALEYVIFYFKYVVRTQPFLLWTWFWGAMVTLVYSVGEGLLPAMTDPLTIDDRVSDIARRANAQPGMVWALRELQAHPAIFNPFRVLRELWLDRAIILGVIFLLMFQFVSIVNLFVTASWRWALLPFVILLPLFIFYARSVTSEVARAQEDAARLAPIAARIARVQRVVQGHTHHEIHTVVQNVEYLNTGTWSPAYHDVECTRPFGSKCFAWIRPATEPGQPRVAELFEWRGGDFVRVPLK